MGQNIATPLSEFPQRAWLAFVLAALVGMGFSVFLVGVHLEVKYGGGEVGGLCSYSSKLNCEVAAGSSYSEVGGLPIALVGFAFYLGILAILIIYRKVGDKWSPNILMALFTSAVLYSFFLAFVSAFVLRSFCWACAVLYVTNVVSLVLSRAMSRQPYRKTLSTLAKNIVQIAPSPAAIAFVISMGVGVAGGYGVFDHLRDGMEKTDDQKLAEANRWVMDEYLKTSRLSKDKIERLHDGPAKGASQALVVITEFSDFECPFCSRVAPDMMKIVSHPFYGEKVKVVFRQNPLDQACNPRLNRPFHKHACTGARVALCAGEQHKFWEMHDQLFANARRLAPKHMAEHGKAVDINTKELRDCVESGRPDKQIKADIELAKEVGVRGTPTIFINGRLVRGAVPYDKLLAAVNYELRELGVKIPVVEPVIEEAPAP